MFSMDALDTSKATGSHLGKHEKKQYKNEINQNQKDLIKQIKSMKFKKTKKLQTSENPQNQWNLNNQKSANNKL